MVPLHRAGAVVTAQVGDLAVSVTDEPTADRQVTATIEVGELSIRAR
jgi:hypothetical protein